MPLPIVELFDEKSSTLPRKMLPISAWRTKICLRVKILTSEAKIQWYHTENILQLNRSIGQFKDNFLGEESQVALEKLDKYLQEIRTAASPIKADEFY